MTIGETPAEDALEPASVDAPDEPVTDGQRMGELLDRIPGAFEDAVLGLEQARSGKTRQLGDL